MASWRHARFRRRCAQLHWSGDPASTDDSQSFASLQATRCAHPPRLSITCVRSVVFAFNQAGPYDGIKFRAGNLDNVLRPQGKRRLIEKDT